MNRKDTTQTKLLQIKHLSHSFQLRDRQVPILHDIDFSLDEDEVVSIVGLSGCGKTTLIKILAGLITPSSSHRIEVSWKGHQAVLSTVAKNIAYMPQTSSLLPWRTVIDNIALPLKVRQQKPIAYTRKIAADLLKEFELEQWALHYPAALSGGMASRISFLRASAQRQPLLLLDEPFGALDAISREKAQQWLEVAWQEQGNAGIFVTHSLSEAVAMGDRVIVMGKRGKPLAGEISVNLPRPRDTQVRTSTEFATILRKVTELLERVGKSY
ncbi:MAG: ABC transporter ATP-binding protein [Actinomycetaceae bacterium]|nr:ABC transporter ATP-binding protein [Actinomycetaceae bacterium]